MDTCGSRTSASSRSRAPAGRCGSSSLPASARRARASTSPASVAFRASSGAMRRWASSRPRLREPSAARARRSGSSPSLASARAASATSSPNAVASAASRSSNARHRRTGARSPSCRCCRCCAPTSASPTATRSGSCARRSPAAPSCSIPSFAEDLPLLFDFLGVPDPDRPVAQLSAEARHRGLRGVVCRLVRAPNRRNSIVALIEDLHWMDEGSANLLGELIAAVEGTKTLGDRQLPARIRSRMVQRADLSRDLTRAARAR